MMATLFGMARRWMSGAVFDLPVLWRRVSYGLLWNFLTFLLFLALRRRGLASLPLKCAATRAIQAGVASFMTIPRREGNKLTQGGFQ